MHEQFPQEENIQKGNIVERPLEDQGAELPRFAVRLPAAKKNKKIIAGVLGTGLLALTVAGVGIGVAHANGVNAPALGTVASHNGGSSDGYGSGHSSRGNLTVTGVSGQTITAKQSDGTAVTIQTTSSTVFTRAGKTVSLSAVTSGEQIYAGGTKNSDGSITAKYVAIELPSYRGTVTAVNGSIITLKDRKGTTQTITTTSSTRFTRGGQSASLSDVKTGDQIAASGTLNSDGSLNAQVVAIVLPHVDGQITTISGTIITIQERDGTTYTIKVSSSTTFTDGQTKGKLSLSDLKVGEEIHAEGTQNSDGSLEAISIVVGHHAPKDGSSGGSQSWNG